MIAQARCANMALLAGGFNVTLSVCLDLMHRRNTQQCISFWQPVSPPGYLPLGHVPSIGLDPPADPVLVYRNDSENGSRPSVKPAREFHLIWRQNGRSPVTMWEPLPPQGYRALGTVVVPDAEQPGSKEVLCVREDLCAKTGIFDSPIWKFEPPIMQVILVNFWCLFAVSEQFKCHVLQVDCQMLSVRQCIHVGTEQPIEA